MKASAVVRLALPSEKHLETVINALEPEVNKMPTTRVKAHLKKEDTSLILRIEARDTIALRAAINVNLRWLNSITRILEVLETQ
jgi:tRNA threonylcarbamoyladenosine modification (KEOPS) complex  Pcc1 subunit